MKKKYAYAFVLLMLFLILMTPWMSGLLFKRNFFHIISLIHAKKNYNVQVLAYRTGWFSSYAKIIIQPSLPNQDKLFSNINATIEQKISHGPLVYDYIQHHWTIASAFIHANLLFEPQEMLFNIPKDQPFIQIESLATFNDTYYFKFLPFSRETRNGLKFSWQGLNGSADFSVADEQINKIILNVTGNPVIAENNLYTLTLSGYTFQSKSTRSKKNILWNQNSNFFLPTLSLKLLNKEKMFVEGFNVLTNSSIEQNFYNSTRDININKINLALQLNAENFVINPATIKIVINHLDANQLTKLSENKSGLNDIPRIITPTTAIKGDVTINTSNGRLLTNAEINWPATHSPTTLEEISLLANLRVKIRVSISLVDYFLTMMDENFPTKSATSATYPSTTSALTQPAMPAANFRMQINEWLNQGYLIKDQNDYVSNMIGGQGKLKINGKDFSPTQRIQSQVQTVKPIAQGLLFNKPAIAQQNLPIVSNPLCNDVAKQIADVSNSSIANIVYPWEDLTWLQKNLGKPSKMSQNNNNKSYIWICKDYSNSILYLVITKEKSVHVFHEAISCRFPGSCAAYGFERKGNRISGFSLNSQGLN